MDDVKTFQLVPIDGVLADVIPIYQKIAGALLHKIVVVDPTLEPPHTMLRMGQAADLPEREFLQVAHCIEKIQDFWLTLPVIPTAIARIVDRRPPPRPDIWYAARVKTPGRSILLQTVLWLEKHGFENPVVWVDEEGAWR